MLTKMVKVSNSGVGKVIKFLYALVLALISSGVFYLITSDVNLTLVVYLLSFDIALLRWEISERD